MDDEDKLLYGDEAEVEEQGQEENVAENEVDLEANQNEDADNGLENGQNQVIFFHCIIPVLFSQFLFIKPGIRH